MRRHLPRHRPAAVIFDMDGVVTETATVHAAAWKRLFDEYLWERAQRTGEQFVPFKGFAQESPDVVRIGSGFQRDRAKRRRLGLAMRGKLLPDGGELENGDGVTHRR